MFKRKDFFIKSQETQIFFPKKDKFKLKLVTYIPEKRFTLGYEQQEIAKLVHLQLSKCQSLRF